MSTQETPKLKPSSVASALQFFVDYFFLWVILFAVCAYFKPAPFTALAPYINPGLGLIMFGMGMTLHKEDFQRILNMKRAVLCGLLGQFLIMPLTAAVLAKVLGLSPELSMGFIIVGSCPGGTASNVISYLSNADVALSVTLTASTTILGVVVTPALIWLYGGAYLPVEPLALLKSVLVIVLLPLAAGMGLHMLIRERIQKIEAVFPAISVLLIILIISAIVGLSQEKIADVAMLVILTAFAHNTIGLGLGYAFAALFRLPEQARRTIAIEVGMQNSGLGVSLATTHFASAPLVALPSAIFSVVHNLTGSLLASVWSRRPTD